jgi:DNA-directed RNA polymerase subunit E'/Rpb7
MNKNKSQENEKEQKIYGVYNPSVITTKEVLHITECGSNIKQNLEKKIIYKIDSRCVEQGFIRPNSIKIMSYSAGVINNSYIEFDVLYNCMICCPVEGMLIECVIKTITKAGIHAEVITDENVIPCTVFVARDHNFTNIQKFNSYKEKMNILVKVIGIRYDLNDPFISVIASLV